MSVHAAPEFYMLGPFAKLPSRSTSFIHFDGWVNPCHSSIVLGLFVFLVLYHGRQVEIASSLDFLWKQQARKELEVGRVGDTF